MRTETRYRQVAYEVYITSDGKEYTNKDDANHHEKVLQYDKCQECNGKGYLEKKTTWE